MTVSAAAIAERLDEISQEISHVVIDTPPARDELIAAAVSASDVVVIPVQPSALDVEAAGPVVSICKRYQKRYCFVITRDDRTTLTAETREALAPIGAVAATTISQFKNVKVAIGHGLTPVDLDADTPAKRELIAVWQEIRQ